MSRFDLTGKVALVTGGIGMSIARGLLECGAAVVIAGRNRTFLTSSASDYVTGPDAQVDSGLTWGA